MKRYNQYILPALCLVAVLVFWEISVYVFHIPLYVLPAPSNIGNALISEFNTLWSHSMVTLQESLLGLLVATILAILIAILMDLSRTFRHTIFPYLVVSQTVPVMILGPLFTMWLGFGLAPKVLMVVFMCFFPIVISFSDALQQVDKKQLDLLRSFGANTIQQYLYIKIPSAATALFSGLKVSATYCIGGAIVGEWLSASAGLGYYMIRVKNGFHIDKVFACVIMVIFWSILLNLTVTWTEHLLFPYTKRRKERK